MRKSNESDKELEGSHAKLANLSRDCKYLNSEEQAVDSHESEHEGRACEAISGLHAGRGLQPWL